ncbi:MAG: DUF2804 domain-containing protein [Deltaproteobacteria bacterium]|nr:DUF2804 domain-containing protein [Deltaproteobacteria bacterium]
MRRILSAAETLVDEAGMPRLGVFDGEFARLNIEQSALRLSGIPLPRGIVRMRTKEWFHAGVILPRGYLGFAVINSKVLGLSFVSFIHRDGTGSFEHSLKGRPGLARVPGDMRSGEGGFAKEGYEIKIATGLDKCVHTVRISAPARGGSPAVEADLRMLEDPTKVQAMVASLPVGSAMTMYTHKCAVACEGSVKVDGAGQLGGEKAIAIIDYHKALYPRHTFWKWATCAGWDAGGGIVGLNLTKNVVSDDWEYNENCLWEGGRMHLLGPAVFERDQADVMLPWKVRTADGAADLVFTPVGKKVENVRMVIARSDFCQVYGTFRGTVRADDTTHEIRDFFGTCEDHDAIW